MERDDRTGAQSSAVRAERLPGQANRVTTMNDQPEPLSSRPRAEAFKVEDLMTELRGGRIRIPRFQRGIRWGRKDAGTLFDSLYRGYPVGILLFWETSARAGTLELGTLRIPAGERSDAWWVVDGQQRLMSLAHVLLPEQTDADDFALFFDLDDLQFVDPRGRAAMADPGRWLPMTVVLDSEQLMQWAFRFLTDDERRRRSAFDLGKRIREYAIPAYLVRAADDAPLREIFGRINSAGCRLDDYEVFDALHGARAPARPASIDNIATDLETLGFGRIDEDKLYRLILVLRDRDAINQAARGPLRLSEQDAGEAYRECYDVAARVVTFLLEDAGIPNWGLLPYKTPFLVLGKFFALHPEPLPRSRDLLARWLWRGALDGSHSGEIITTRKNLKRITPDSEHTSVQQLLRGVAGEPVALPRVEDEFNFRYAQAKLAVLALLDLKPRALASGAPVTVDELIGKGGAIGIPKIITGISDNLARAVVNRVVHPKGAGLRRQLAQISDEAILSSHGISRAGQESLRAGDLDAFFRERGRELQGRFNAFFFRKARWNETDRPPISVLRVVDEAAE
jgi:hypothetical protein